jgi:hypothetical protein
MSECFIQYLGKDGKPSATYYANLEKLGHDKALKLYLAEMASFATAKMSKKVGPTSVDDLKKIDKEHRRNLAYNVKRDDRTKEQLEYAAKFAGVSLIRDDVASRSFNDPENKERITTLLAKKQIALEHYADKVKELKKKTGRELGEISLSEDESKELRETVDKWVEDNPQEFLEYKDEVTEKWGTQARQATVIHAVLEEAVSIWAKRVKDKKDNDKINLSVNSVLSEAKGNVSANIKAGKLPTVGKRTSFDPGIKGGIMDQLDEGLKYYYKKVIGDITTKYSPEDGWTILPELYLKSDKLKHKLSGESTEKYLHGMADLVLVNEITGKAVIYEYKTKSEKSANTFDNPLAEQMKGIFSDYSDTAKNQTIMQMSMTAMMLEEYGYDVIANNLVLIEGELSNKNFEKPVSERKKNWYFSTLKQFEDRSPISSHQAMRSELQSLFNIEEEIIPTNIGDAMDSIASGELEYSKYSKADYIKRASGRIKEKDGKFTWWNTFTRKSESARSMDEMLKIIGKARDDYESRKTKMPADLLSYFNNSKHNRNSLLVQGNLAEIPSKILAGLNSETHKLELAKNIKGLEDVGDDVLIATNKDNGEVSILSLMPRGNSKIKHETDDENFASTVFGAYMTDKGYRQQFGSLQNAPTSDVHNMTLLKLALVGTKLKQLKGEEVTGIPLLKVITAYTESDSNMQTSTMEEQLTNLKRLRTIAGDEAPDVLKELFDDRAKEGIAETYKGDHVNYLLELIRRNRDPLKGQTLYSARSIKSSINKHIRESASNERDYELVKLFEKYGRALYNTLRDEGLDRIDIVRDARMVQFRNAYLSLRQIDTGNITNFKAKGLLGGKFKTLDTSKDYYGQNVDRLIALGQQQTTFAMSEFVTDLNRHVEALYELNNVSMGERVFSLDATRGFDNLYADTEFKDGNEENWMRLKDEEDSTLRKEEVEFIKFFKQSLLKGYEYIKGPNLSQDFKDKINMGYVPLIGGDTAMKKFRKAENIGDVIKVAGEIFQGGKATSDNLTLEGRDKVDSRFAKQIDSSSGVQGSKDRRDRLGLDEEGNQVRARQEFLTNPVAVMTTFMLDAVQSEFMSSAAYGASVVVGHLEATEQMTGNSTQDLRELINTLSVIRIHNIYKDEGKMAKVLDTVAKGTSLGMFWMNLRQIITESAVGVSQVATSSVSNSIMALMPKTEQEIEDANKGIRTGPRFSAKAMAEAGKKAPTALGKQIIQDLGLHKVDPEYFKSDEFMLTKKMSIFKTSNGFAVQQNIISRSIAMFGMAQLAEQGILDAYSLDEDTKKYIYKEENDPRFYVYDPDLKIDGKQIGHKNPPTSEADKRKHALWVAHRSDLGLEGGIGSNGRMRVPVASKENGSIRYYAQKMIPTMDASKVTLGEATVMYRMLLRFKRWMVQKGANYWQTRHESDLNGRWVYNKDAEGNYIGTWEGQPMEGMIQSLLKLVNDMKDMGITQGFRSMDQIQKENLSKMLIDIMMMLVLMELAHLMSEFGMRDSTLGNEMFRAVQNSIGDMMPLIAIGEAFNREPFGTVGVVTSAARNMVEFTYYSVIREADETLTDEEIINKAKAAADRAMKASGLYRGAKGVAEWMEDGEL